ncbi:MAG: HD phosphohydrolase domain-containing protein [Faunusvirus sp.]|jgi:HD superfamily phosphohydrolase|uniref:HD phosphohydrolase domain-containing protein n=1 Tax=Faunusvirus sp. TaxID=2487766 RepID=A0A3G4ZX79_9VIRU|nr:MAG: HD phosphohydrolase domain-containing protein [Faunusvirus sp.]
MTNYTSYKMSTIRKSKMINDTVHGYIELEPYLMDIIDTPVFQRLRNIKQLGVCYYVFPGASHNRFEHSIGVSYLAGLFINNIRKNQPQLDISDNDVKLIKIAGLVHDLGHACFSHFFDNIFLPKSAKYDQTNPNNHHEHRSIQLLRYVVAEYKMDLSGEDITKIDKLVNPDKDNSAWYYNIISNNNGLDCDRMDYLCRDTHNLAFPSRVDYSRIIMQARVIDNVICFPDKLEKEMYNFYHVRYQLHTQIYCHPKVKQIEHMINDVLIMADDEYKISESIDNPMKFCELTDDILYRIEYSTVDTLSAARDIIRKIRTRDLYKFVGEIFNPVKTPTINDFITDEITVDDIIFEKIKIDYTKGKTNPVQNIYFYSLSDKSHHFKIDGKQSVIQPIIYEEEIYRVYCRNKTKLDKVKTIFAKMKNTF